jgi:hypothetical protein
MTNAESCRIVEIAFKLLQDAHHETFVAAERAEREALAARMKTEPLLLIDPGREPELMAETPFRSDTPRAPESWTMVDERLREIGFAIETIGNVTTYKYMISDNLMVLADPREAGKVEFGVFKRSGKYRWKRDQRVPSLRDNWKDWPAKFRARLLQGAKSK